MTKTIYQTLTLTKTKTITITSGLVKGYIPLPSGIATPPSTTMKTTTPPSITITTTTEILKFFHPLTLTYSFSLTEQIGDVYQASPGYIYLIVHLFIENQGDLPFVTQARNFKIVIQNVKYANLMVPLDNELKEVELLHGGKVSGDLVFEVQNIWGEKAPPLEPDFQEILLIYEQS